MKLNRDTEFSENQIVQHLIDFLLLKKDAPALESLLADAFESTPLSLLFFPEKTSVSKQALLEALQYKGEFANSSKDSPPMIALQRLKLFLLLGMTVPEYPVSTAVRKRDLPVTTVFLTPQVNLFSGIKP